MKSLAPNLSAQSPALTPSLWSSLCSEPWAGCLPVTSGARGLDSLLVLRQSEMTAIRGEISAQSLLSWCTLGSVHFPWKPGYSGSSGHLASILHPWGG